MEEITRQNDALGRKIEALEAERQPFLEALKAAGIAVAESILRGQINPRTILREAIAAGAAAAAEEFARVQGQINELRESMQINVEKMKIKIDAIVDVNTEESNVNAERRRLRCDQGPSGSTS